MIRVNLLPPEMKKAARTPKVLFFTLIIGVAVTMLFGFTSIWLWISLKSLQNEVENRQIGVTIAQQRASEVDRIREDIAIFKDREKVIIEIRSRRILWGLKLMQLVATTPQEIWITRFSMDTLDPSQYKWDNNKGPQTGGRLSLTCYAQGIDATTLTNFRAQLSGVKRFYGDLIEDNSAFPDNFFGDFLAFAPHSWSQVKLDGYAEPNNLYSVIDIDLKPLYKKPAPEPQKKRRRNKKKKRNKKT